MYNSENLQEKWQPVLNHPDLPEITDAYKRAVTSVILENQEREMNAQQQMLAEADLTTGAVANFNPVLISLVRRAMPNLMAYDVCGVQPMTGPTGLIFAMKARYGGGNTSNTEALFDGAQTQASGKAGIAAADGADADTMNYAFGIQKVGNLNSKYEVYKNPYMTENTILLGFKGSQFLETGATFAPYIPLIMTPLVYDPTTFTPRKGLLTRYAKKMLRPEYYAKIFVAGLNNL